MAKAFGILTAILLSLSAFLAVKNHDSYKLERENREKETNNLLASEDRLKRAQEDLKLTKANREKTEAEVARLDKEKTDLTSANAQIKSDIDTKTADAAKQKTQLEEIREKLAGIGEIETLVPLVKTTKSQIEELEQNIRTAETTLANLTAESGRLDKVIENYRTISALYPAKKSNPALKTRISAIYSNYGFVTLGAGNLAGVITSSNLEVVRDGEVIAKLLVTAVERNTASASIVPDSLKEDTVLMVGDTVVPAK